MKMIVRTAMVLFLLTAAAYAAPQGTQPNAPQKAAPAAKALQEGEWEITIKTDMAGVPFPMPPMVHTQCITRDDRKDVAKTLPSASANREDCTVKSHKTEGSKTTWQVQCKDGSTGSGEMVQQTASYTGKMTLETLGKDQGATKIVKHITGKRLGDCK